MTVGAHERDHRESAQGALQWMRSFLSPGKQFVFRGQTRVFPTIIPSMYRGDHITETERGQWYSVLRRFATSRNGLTGYDIPSTDDAVAIVQHYLVKSPVIDVTGTPEVALYFAMLSDRSSSKPRVVYAADVDLLRQDGKVVTDHGFLALPLQSGGLAHRWLRQDGYTVGVSDWRHFDVARALDFSQLPGVKSCTFDMQPGEWKLVEHLGDLETTKGDPLASKVRSMFEIIAQELDCLDAVRRLMPNEGTIDARTVLLEQIRLLLRLATEADMDANTLEHIHKVLEAANGKYWDTSWDAALDLLTRKVATSQKKQNE